MNKWKSRKLWVSVGSVLTVVLTNFGLPEAAAETVTEAVMVIAGLYLVGQSGVDAVKQKRKAE